MSRSELDAWWERTRDRLLAELGTEGNRAMLRGAQIRLRRADTAEIGGSELPLTSPALQDAIIAAANGADPVPGVASIVFADSRTQRDYSDYEPKQRRGRR